MYVRESLGLTQEHRGEEVSEMPERRSERLLRLPQVLALVGVGRSTLYAMVSRGDFPAQVRIGRRSVGWRRWQVYDWIRSRPTIGDTTPDAG